MRRQQKPGQSEQPVQSEPQKVCILGMGYVGLTMALVLAEKGFNVTGVDVDENAIKAINAHRPRIMEEGLLSLLDKHLDKNFTATTLLPTEKQDICILAVGTPVDMKTKSIIYDYIRTAAEQLRSIIKEGALVILRSTVSIGATRTIVKPILDEMGLKYYLAFCPERTIQGKAIRELSELPQVIGGADEESADKAEEFFRKMTPNIVRVSSLEAAELIKKINNSYRDLTFSFANDVAELCENCGLDAYEVIMKSNEGYARSSIPLPGFVGGYCLTKDPYILLGLANRNGVRMDTILNARKVNEALPHRAAERIHLQALALGMDPGNAKVFITGFAFKGNPDTDDLRSSPTVELLKALQARGYENVHGHDFVVGEEKMHALPLKLVNIDDGFKDADIIIIANNNKRYNSLEIERMLGQAQHKQVIFFDAWGLFRKNPLREDKRIHYMAIGIRE